MTRLRSTSPDSPGPEAIDLAASLHGRARGSRRDRIESHLASCGECRRALIDLRRMLGEPVLPGSAMPDARLCDLALACAARLVAAAARQAEPLSHTA